MMRDHRKLRAFELADQLPLSVYASTRDFPRDEMFGLVTQMRRAAVSAASNIVEGCARNSLANYLRFLDMAYGSMREVEYQISLASRLGYLKDDGISSLATETSRVLNGLIRSLRPSTESPPA
jgi:four helix bundle protein